MPTTISVGTGAKAPRTTAPAAAVQPSAMDQAMARIAELEAKNAALQAQAEGLQKQQQTGVRIRVNAKGQPTGRHNAIGKGTISVFGIQGTGRWGLTFYPRGWQGILSTLGASSEVAQAIAQAIEKYTAVLDWGNAGDIPDEVA